MKLSPSRTPGDVIPRHWLDRDEATVLRILKSLNSESDDIIELRMIVAQLLRRTDSNGVRNAAALALVDLGATDAADDIIDVLRRPEIAKASGTLIYALDELGASMPLHVLAHLIERGSYEARAQALFFFEENRITLSSEDEWEEGRQLLASLAISDDLEAAEAGRLALDSLDAVKQPSKALGTGFLHQR